MLASASTPRVLARAGASRAALTTPRPPAMPRAVALRCGRRLAAGGTRVLRAAPRAAAAAAPAPAPEVSRVGTRIGGGRPRDDGNLGRTARHRGERGSGDARRATGAARARGGW